MAYSKALEDTLKAINKKYGKGTITTASKAVALKIERIPTGSLKLDTDTGGGYPEGRITIIAGPYSGGKTFLAFHAIREAQRKYPDRIVVFIDQEGTFDSEWAEKFGIDLERLEIVRPATAEHAWDILHAFIQIPDVSMVVLDSMAALVTGKILEQSAEDSEAMGGNAKMNNKNLAKTQAILNLGSLEDATRRPPAVLIINQLRSSMDKYKPEFMPGGRGQEYYASVIIWVRIGDKYLEKRAGEKEPVYVGHELKYKTEKNKTFPPKKSGSFDIYVEHDSKGHYPAQIDRLKEVTLAAIYWKVVKKSGSWFTILDNPEWKFQGSDKVVDYLRENPDVMAQVEEAVMEAALVKQKPDSTEEIEYVDEERFLDEETGYEIDPETGEIISE